MTGLFPLETWVIKNLSIVYFQFINLDILKAKKSMWCYSFFGAVARLVLIGWSVLTHQESELLRRDGKWFYCICSTVNSRTFFWHLAPGEKLHCNERDGILDARGLLEIQSAPWMWNLTTSVGFCGVNTLVFFCIFFCSVQTHLKFGKRQRCGSSLVYFPLEKLVSALVSRSIFNVTSHCFYFIFTAQIKLASC